ncbi:MAG: hypothetical protein ACI4NL_03570, partial [Christensenellales bacterium]
FAIALALVMVLSMASAFAACPTINWACSTSVCTDGKGSVEVVPYVKGNACPGQNTWTANTCAGAVNGDWAYAAVKVTVDADANEEWWDAATLTLTTKGAVDGTLYAGAINLVPGIPGYVSASKYEFAAGYVAGLIKGVEANEGELKAGVYYLVSDTTTGWKAVPAADFEAGPDTLFYAKVNDASKVKFCATLKSKVDASAGAWYSIGDYEIKWEDGGMVVWNGKPGSDMKIAKFHLNSSDLIEKVTYDNDGDGTNEYVLTSFGFIDEAGKNVGASCDGLDWLAKVMEYFKFDFRTTCYTKKAFKANFGWDDKVESCFSWSSNVTSVVDAECVVAIPKTGDVSVVAYAVMAVVAAAGAMLKK